MEAIYIECRKVDFRFRLDLDFRFRFRLENEHVACLNVYLHMRNAANVQFISVLYHTKCHSKSASHWADRTLNLCCLVILWGRGFFGVVRHFLALLCHRNIERVLVISFLWLFVKTYIPTSVSLLGLVPLFLCYSYNSPTVFFTPSMVDESFWVWCCIRTGSSILNCTMELNDLIPCPLCYGKDSLFL